MSTALEIRMQKTCHIADEFIRRISVTSVVRRDELLAKRTTLRVGGPADVYIEPATEADLAKVVQFCHERENSLLRPGSRVEFAGA